MKPSGDVLQIHQDNLKPIVPKIGKLVKILKRGDYRRQIGQLLEYDLTKKEAKIQLKEDKSKIVYLSYGEFSKLA